MAEETIQRFGIEGADPLLLAGVNDANLVELGRTLGVRATLRGDTLALSGPADQVDRGRVVVQALRAHIHAPVLTLPGTSDSR